MTEEEKKKARQETIKKYNDKTKELRKQWYEENKERIKANNKKKQTEKSEYNQSYYQNNKEREKKRVAEYRANNPDKVKVYASKSKVIRNQWEKNKRETDILFKLKQNIRANIRLAIKRKCLNKTTKTELILGCSFEEFKNHLESKFEPWMNWGNMGNPKDGILGPNKSWDIDHIIPVSKAITVEELAILNHYTNLQPLCSYINRNIKRNLTS